MPTPANLLPLKKCPRCDRTFNPQLIPTQPPPPNGLCPLCAWGITGQPEKKKR